MVVSPSLITEIDSPAKEIHVSLSRDQIAHSAPLEQADVELVETLPPFVIM